VKYWFSITSAEQHKFFLMRIRHPLMQWKLSPMYLQSRVSWVAYAKAEEAMLEQTHIPKRHGPSSRPWTRSVHA